MSYNGIGLQTTRGSGTNGYVQTNKFHRSASRLERKEWKDLKEIHGEGGRGGAKKPCEDILEHNRKREIERKLVELEDDLEERGIAREEIDEMLKDARRKQNEVRGERIKVERSNERVNSERAEVETLEAEREQVQKELDEREQKDTVNKYELNELERTEQEREFYFEKLQDIEFLCQRPEFADTALARVVEKILYFTEGKPDVDAIIRECRDAPEGEAAAPVPAAPLTVATETIVPAEEEAVATPTFDEAAALGAALENECVDLTAPSSPLVSSLCAPKGASTRAPLSPQPTNAL